MRFLGRAKKFLQDLGTEPAKAQTFNLACASGHRVRGERTEGYQALRCPSCGEGVFVLPRSPLPEPEAPAGVATARGASRRSRSPWVDEGPVELTDPVHGAGEPGEGRPDGDGAEIIWEDEPEEAGTRGVAAAAPRVAPEDLAAAEIEEARRNPAAASPRPDRARASGRGDGPRPDRPARPPRGRERRPAPQPLVVEARPKARGGPRLGLIFAMLALLIVASVGWRAWRNRRAQDPLIAERGRVEGIPALERGEFDLAYQLLSRARSAVDALGGAVEGAGEIRQAADEAAVFVDLCPESLEDLLADAGRMDPEAWAMKFDTHYKGHYYLFGTFVLSTPQQGGGYEIGYVVFPPGEASRFGDGGLARPDRFAGIDLTGFRLFEQAEPSRGDRVTFGAKLESIAYDSERRQWMVRLAAEGGTFITHSAALQAIGWPTAEAVDLPREDQP